MMKRYLYSLLLILSCSCSVFGQQYGNEWIDFTQRYFAFNVYKTGFQRIDHSALVAAGVPVSTFSSANMQIFGREREVPILVVDGNDNSFDAGDYLLFFAEKNNGWIDSLVYPDPTYIANPSFSLYNDTIQYFFTWNSQTNNQRFTIDTDVAFGSYGAPASYLLKDLTPSCPQSYAMHYSEGFRYELASGSIYSPGEGWACGAVTLGGQYDAYMYTAGLYTGADAPLPRLETAVTSNSNAEQNPDHHLRLTVGSGSYLIADTVFEGYHQLKYTNTLPPGTLDNATTLLTMRSINNLGANADALSLTWWRLRYPRTTASGWINFDDFRIDNNPNAASTQVNLQELNSLNAVVFCFGADNRALTPVLNGNIWQFIVPNNAAGPNSRIVIGDLSSAAVINGIEAVNGSGQFTDFSNLSMEEAVIMVYHPSLQAASAAYANYRGSAAGGNHNVILANVNELYQQYGGGVEKHILGIRRFAKQAYDLAVNDKPAGLFLMGKGISEKYGARTSNPQFHHANLIPTFGYPPSDIAITAGFRMTQDSDSHPELSPLIPTGRIAARNNQELADYLDKVIEYEDVQVQNDPNNYTTASKDWQKQILHFVGGSDITQQTSFKQFMDNMKDIIEDSVYGGNVTSYYKTSSDPLDPTVVAGVTDRIASGVSLMNFFGHAAASNNGFEINIDDPSNWENEGKYPVVLGNSCYNGDIFTSTQMTSERFVNLPDEGAIAFISNVSVGYATYLDLYSNQLYRHFSHYSYGQTLGEQMKRTVEYVDTTYWSPGAMGTIIESTCIQMTLHGDPMLRLNWHERPEIEITPQSVYFEPGTLNLTVDSIELNLILTNLGKSVVEPFDVVVVRDFPATNVDSTYTITLQGLNYKDTVSLMMPLQPNISVGINNFQITVDLPSMIAEQAEEVTNNQLAYDYFINIDGIMPVYPYDFAVVPYDSVTVRASTINPTADYKTYRFQLDTVDTYDSPQFRQFSMTEPGGVKEVGHDEWLNSSGMPFPLTCTDSTVYFWRVALDSSVLNWVEYSFQYIPGKTGWGQDHFFQFKKNDFYNVTYNRTDRIREFSEAEPHVVEITAYDNPTVWNSWSYDGALKEYAALFFGSPAIYVFVIDPLTMEPWGTRYLNQNPDHNFGNGNDNPDGNDPTLCYTCHPSRPEFYFAFEQSDPAQLAAFENMIENEIPDGHYVGIYTVVETEYGLWDANQPSLYTMFQNLGSTLVNNTQPEKPFAMFFRKGEPATLVESHYPDTITNVIGNYVTVSAIINSPEFSGIERTPLIGPALDWGTLYWKRDSLDAVSVDSVRIYIEGRDISGTLQMTIDTVFTPNDSILQLNNLVDASAYPYMTVGMYYYDDTLITPAQVDRIHVLYQPVPEAAIDGTTAYYMTPIQDTLQEGQLVSFAVDVRNISDYDMDSLLVKYWVEDVDRVKHFIPYPVQAPLLSGDTLRDTIQFSTADLPGLNSLWMEVNPYINGSLYITDQPEQYHFNNLLQMPFFVQSDDEHPILDVTFNGQHILNGDIINPESEILITLKDDNPYLIMDQDKDTTLFGIYLTDPSGVQRRIPFMDAGGNVVMQWIPADSQNKKFKIIYPTLFETDGKYTLIVQGTDRSGNLSGDIEYRISFEVIHESSITYLMNYPNPFSTSTRFVFTLTGSEVPEDMIIQIMTVTGRVVREITEDEIGPITIGRNITEFAWDGTDEFGDRLANGVYLYHVKARINGEDIKHRESGADNYFKKEFGKMYLMR